jgi:hypothetical protein
MSASDGNVLCFWLRTSTARFATCIFPMSRPPAIATPAFHLPAIYTLLERFRNPTRLKLVCPRLLDPIRRPRFIFSVSVELR